MPEAVTENYLIFSDVHLGADLVQHVRPWTRERLKQIARIDRDLASMLDWYREHRDPERPWRLIIAGDLVDFIGMSIAPLEGAPLASALSAEEELNGLGSSRDRAVAKMRAVARRHGLVFEKLARFVADGHSLVLVRGNHDIDFHWDEARAAFVEAIVERAGEERREELAGRIEFHPWFYYVEGLLYVEHGHQYDELCSYPHLLAPVLPHDPKQISWSLSDVLLRFVVRPTPGVGSEGHEHHGALDYIRLAFALGIVGMIRLGQRYLRAGAHALRTTWSYVGSGPSRIAAEHERALELLSTQTRLGVERLRALAALAPPSATSRPMAILRSLMLDRVALVAISTLVLVSVFGLHLAFDIGLLTAALVATPTLASAVGLAIWSSRFRVIDPSDAMRRSAESIARMLPVLYVVMGHTHQPVVQSLAPNTTYVNVGNWAVDDLDGPDRPPPRTHLVIRHVDGRPVAEFCAWDPATGPRVTNVG